MKKLKSHFATVSVAEALEKAIEINGRPGSEKVHSETKTHPNVRKKGKAERPRRTASMIRSQP